MKKFISAMLCTAFTVSAAPAVFADNSGTVLKDTAVIYCDLSNESQVTSDADAKDIPILTGSAEYAEESGNIRLKANSGAGIKLNLNEPLTTESSENVVTIEFDANFGKIDKQYFDYQITDSNGAEIIGLHFMPYNKSNAAGYLRVDGNDIINDITDDSGSVTQNINSQLTACTNSVNGDGMTSTVTHFQNKINLYDGNAEITISSGSKSGTFTGSFDSAGISDIAGLDMSITKNTTSRYTYIDNIKVSQMRYTELPKPEELTYNVTVPAEGDITAVDTSKVVYGDHVSMLCVTTADENGNLLNRYTTGAADSINVNTAGAALVEVVPVYSYTELSDTIFNTANGSVLENPTVLGEIPDGRYDISIQKSDEKLTDIYINGAMAVNNAEQPGKGRGSTKGSLCTVNDIKIDGGKVRINTQRDEYNGRTYPNAPISSVTITPTSKITNRKTKITILGDSLVCNYYGGRRESDLGSNQTGWGQQLSNFIDTNKYEIVNLANSGHYAKILYETAMSGALANSLPGDIILCQCGYNDRVRSKAEEMTEYMTKMYNDASAAGLKIIFVAPPATCDPETKYNDGYANPIDTTADDYVNSSYSYPVRYSDIVEQTAASLGAGFINLSEYSYNYLTSIYGKSISTAKELYVKNMGVSDYIHLSYTGAMKWGSFIAQSLYDNGYVNDINTDFNYTVTDSDGNDIVCRVYDGDTPLPDNHFKFYTASRGSSSITITVKPQTEGYIYASLYTGSGRLIAAKQCEANGSSQSIEFDLPSESGTYMKVYNWNETIEPVHEAGETIYIDSMNIDIPDYVLAGKSVYAFGDSIVYGHNKPEKSFMKLISDDYDMNLGMYAVNGASVICTDSSEKEDPEELAKGNYIINQIRKAPSEAPDVIVFDGYTNDAYGDPKTDKNNSNGGHINVMEHLGTIQGSDASEFDNSTFCGGFEQIIYEMKQKWQNTPIVFVTIHKSGGRDFEIQSKLRELSLEICEKWGVNTADIYADTSLDTRDAEQMSKYIINGAGSHPNELACREFYMPVIVGKLKSILADSPIKLPDNINESVDLAVFAGQSNMSGRGTAADSVVCDVNAGFEYKSVSRPNTLLPIQEPFGLNEDVDGKLTDINTDGSTKRTGSMVSAFVNEYYKNTGNQLVAVSASKGGTSTAEWKENLISDAVTRLDNAKKFLTDNGIKINKTFIVWCQGETDGDNNVSAEEYTQNTINLWNEFKNHGAEHMFIIQTGHYNYIKYPSGGESHDAKYKVIRDAQQTLCESNDDFTLAASLEPYLSEMKDQYHYNQSAYNAAGTAAGAAAAEYYK